MLLAAVVGSGIMAERLAGGNVAIALLASTVATGAPLVALILTFGIDFWAAFQSRGHDPRCLTRRSPLARRSRLRFRANHRRHARRLGRTCVVSGTHFVVSLRECSALRRCSASSLPRSDLFR
jgi:hypothetical protein